MEDQFLSEVHLDLKPNLIAEESKQADLSKQKYVTRIPLLMDQLSIGHLNFEFARRLDDEVADKYKISSSAVAAEISELDDDGDFEINRIPPEDNSSIMLTFVHCKETDLFSVGLQIWRASLFLLDFIFSKSGEVFDENSHCIELGCGIGVCSSILQMKVKYLIASDKDKDILDCV